MIKKPYAVGVCMRTAMVILSDGQHAHMTGWLDEGFEPVYETGPETPADAIFIGYELRGKLCATEVHNVSLISLH